MSVSLEPVGVPESETTPVGEPQISEKNVETPADVVGEPPVAIESESKPILPEPKKRGRPRKEVPKEPKTPKAAPKKAVRMKAPSPVNESSSEEETPLTRDDMGRCYWTTLSNASNRSNRQDGECGVSWLG